jgi:hypothetical protein
LRRLDAVELGIDVTLGSRSKPQTSGRGKGRGRGR